MQKLKYSILEKLNSSSCTQTELALLLYVGRFQDKSGLVRGVYYKDAVTSLNISVQSFYNAREGLKEKGIIEVKKESIPDSDIRILGNDFSDENYQCGYIDLQHQIFEQKQFLKSTANEILLALELIKNAQSAKKKKYRIGTATFITDYSQMLHVKERAVRKYLQRMRRFFNIGLFERKYYISLKEKFRRDEVGKKGEEECCREQVVDAGLRRARIKEVAERDRKDVIGLLQQYAKEATEKGLDAGKLLLCAIQESILVINEARRKRNYRYYAKPSLIHKLFLVELKNAF